MKELEANLTRAIEALRAIDQMGSLGAAGIMWALASGALADIDWPPPEELKG